MPSVFLSPSTQEFNRFINGGNEEYYMNRIADAMIPYLRASGIEFTRSNPGESVEKVIERSNEFPHDLHLALHSRGNAHRRPNHPTRNQCLSLLFQPDKRRKGGSYHSRKPENNIPFA